MRYKTLVVLLSLTAVLSAGAGCHRKWPIGLAASEIGATYHVDTAMYVILKYDRKNDIYFDKSQLLLETTLTTSEVDGMEPLVKSGYQRFVKKFSPNYLGLRPLVEYRRQYVAAIDSKGQKEVRILFFCEAPERWRKVEMLVDDGGASVLYLWINLTLERASELDCNGVA